MALKNRFVSDADGMDVDDIAKELGVSRQAIEATLYRGLRKLKRECERRGLTLQDLLENIK